MKKQVKERQFTDEERNSYIKAKAEFDAGTDYGQVLFDKKDDLSTKTCDAETYDYIKTLREIYHSVESSIYARRMAHDCLDRHSISVKWENVMPDR